MRFCRLRRAQLLSRDVIIIFCHAAAGAPVPALIIDTLDDIADDYARFRRCFLRLFRAAERAFSRSGAIISPFRRFRAPMPARGALLLQLIAPKMPLACR